MTTIADKVAVVTGAASGIGRALALGLADRGARLALADVNATGLAETVDLVAATGTEVQARHLDVSDRADVETYAGEVRAHFGVVHQLYNNAGIAGISGTILETDWAVFERVLAVNLWGVLHGTKAFLPHLIASGDGHLINISSLNGFMAQGELGPYCTSKFGVRGFTETLRIEMLAANLPVRVTVVHPGGVRTNIANAALERARERGEEITEDRVQRTAFYNERFLRLPPERAADIIVRGVEANRGRVLVGNDARLTDLAVRLLPRHYPDLSVRILRRLLVPRQRRGPAPSG
ncbi:SDR family oxidoreductase [Frankia sp. AgB32]|uniref:SDR family NAD(P)-dependent oxidoreductase n=1 Tax=Frankia sp. AgB32 TaxID=631119 RepID=UPI00200C17DB|nr:SDR family NAD(P)-dependent oxidoreductase [Frankia sp. AgB32]MCK9898247.1 SDR family NAD(P)-dependent oxidoreductase [Frankia sp. AgB32]